MRDPNKVTKMHETGIQPALNKIIGFLLLIGTFGAVAWQALFHLFGA